MTREERDEIRRRPRYIGGMERLASDTVLALLDALDAQDWRLEQMRSALAPFAAYCNVLDENRHPDSMLVGYYRDPAITVGDCRAAARVLKGGEM